MANGLEPLARLEYPGRLIVIGRLPDGLSVVGYGITGRSPASRARRLAIGDDGNVYTRPTDEETLKTGNPALLVYPAIIFTDRGLAVSNGAQTSLIAERLLSDAPADEPTSDEPAGDAAKTLASDVLRAAFAAPRVVEGIDLTSYEPDAPNHTPRISGCVRATSAALQVVRHGKSIDRLATIFNLGGLEPGRARAISTYAGPNTNPLPSFPGEPLRIAIEALTLADFAEALYEAIGPGAAKTGTEDLRVAIAAAAPLAHRDQRVHIINRVDR